MGTIYLYITFWANGVMNGIMVNAEGKGDNSEPRVFNNITETTKILSKRFGSNAVVISIMQVTESDYKAWQGSNFGSDSHYKD